MVIQKIDDFYQSQFMSKLEKIQQDFFKKGDHVFRIVLHEGRSLLQRRKSSQMLYDNKQITSQGPVWENIHDGLHSLVEIDADILDEINHFFSTSYKP